jgi:hypothetical protein
MDHFHFDNVRFRSLMEECNALSRDVALEQEFRSDAVRLFQECSALLDMQGSDDILVSTKEKALEKVEAFIKFHKDRIANEGAA